MAKDIKDYIHLYCGQLAQISELSQRMIAYGWEDGQVKITGYLIDCLEKEDAFNIKPILRPLSDMADEEAKKVVMIALKRDDATGLKINRTPERNYVSIWYAQWLPMGDYQKKQWTECDLEICISDDFTIYNHTFYRKGNGTAVGNEPLYHQHETTAYLLSKGFDLFGLIEAGLAIDKTKVTSKLENLPEPHKS